jgi:uncharacterized protein
MIAIADTSYVVAVAIETDKNHERCMAVHRQQRTIFLPQSTLAETGYLLTKLGGNRKAASFLAGLSRSKYKMVALEPQDIARTAELPNQYADSRLDFVDATIVAIAERLQLTRILTLDSRDFSLVRPRHAEHFELLPIAAG